MQETDKIHKEIAQVEYDSYTIWWDAYTRESNNLIGPPLTLMIIEVEMENKYLP